MKHSSIIGLILFLLINTSSFGANKDVYWGWAQSPVTNELKALKINAFSDIYIGVWGDGIYKSDDGGKVFINKSTGLTNLYITSIQIDSSGALWVTTYGGGAFRSYDDGFSWSPVNSGLTDLNVKDIVFDNDGDGFIATKSKGIFFLQKGTSNWKAVNYKLHYHDINTLISIKSNGAILAGTNGGGIYRSRDKGQTWEKANTGIKVGIINDFYEDDLLVYVATLGQGILHSLADGSSWSNSTETKDMPLNPTCITKNKNSEMVVGTIDDGVWYYDKWNQDKWRKSAHVDNGVSAIATLPTGEIFALVTADGLRRSTDNGLNFYFMTFKFMDIIKEIIADGNTLYCLVDTIPWRSDDRGDTWKKLKVTAPATRATCLCLDSTKAFYIGTNKGVWKSTDKGESFSRYGTKFDDSLVYNLEASPNGVLFASSGYIFKIEPDTLIWKRKNLATAQLSPNVYFFGINKDNEIYANDNNIPALFVSRDTASHWTIMFFNEEKTYESIDFNANLNVFIGSNEGLLVSTDHGANWQTFSFSASSPGVSKVVVDKNQSVYAAVSYSKLLLCSDNYEDRQDTVSSGILWSNINALAASNTGYTYAGTTQIYRHVDSLEMLPTKAIYPPNDTGGIALKPVFKWTSADKAELYQFQIAIDPDFESIFEEVFISDTTWALESVLQYREFYYWRVRTKNNSSYTQWTTPSMFKTIFEPPTLHLPEKGITSLPLEVDLHWFPMKEINSYKVEVATDSLFKNIVFQQDDIVDTTVTVKGLTHLKVYYWRVRAKTTNVIGLWSEVWNFRTLLPPPKLLKPANKSYGHESVVKMQWTPVSGGEKYVIDISEKGDFSTHFYNGATDNDDDHTIKLLEYFTTYYWRISALDEFEKQGDWSETWSYTTIIDSTTLRSPDNGITNTSNTMTLKWDSKTNATEYHLQVAELPNMTKLIIDDTTLTQNELKDYVFQHYKQYYWRVAVRNGIYEGKWSDIWSFKTGIGRPELKSPEHLATKQPTALYLNWQKTNGALSYHLQLSKEESLTQKILDENNIDITQREVIDLELDTKYYWRVLANYEEGQTQWSDTWQFTTTDVQSVKENNPIFAKLSLSPNPFSHLTTINYSIKQAADITLSIFDVNGELLHSEILGWHSPGEYYYKWDASKFSQGVYNIVISSGVHSASIKTLIIK